MRETEHSASGVDESATTDALRNLVRAAYGMHVADQIALVSVPLVAAIVFNATAGQIGLLVACQSLGQLLGSIPFGLIVDRFHARWVVMGATIISAVGFAGAWFAIATSNLVVFGLLVTLAGFGIVLFLLVALAMIPVIAGAGGVARANSRVEIPRSVMSLAVPLVVGATITSAKSDWVFAPAFIGPVYAFIVATRLPNIAPRRSASTTATTTRTRLSEGGKFVIAQGHLRAITLCSLSWNFAFSVLLVAMVPLLKDLGKDPGVFGIALASFGLAAVIGSWLAGRLSNSVEPRIVLMLGPASSVLAAGLVLAAHSSGSVAFIYAGFLVLGLGPSMWIVAQNTVRQLVTPRDMLGRVNAMIQTAIYGVRPIGAIVGGALIGATSPRIGLLAVAAAFVLSTAAALASGLRTVQTYAELELAQS